MIRFSQFGKKFTQASGITQLMADLGHANQSKDIDICMLGGGNPAVIPAATTVFQQEMQLLLDQTHQFDQMLGNYDGPQGSFVFIDALITLLNNRYDWGLTRDNICLSNGSQNSFFNLFNLLAGDMPDGSQGKILLPLAPEYIGYYDQGINGNIFISEQATIESISEFQFKYRINFTALKKKLETHSDIVAICVSRPTNPTGNVLTDKEMYKLDSLAKKYQIPLIVDNAYGFPFPGAIYVDANPNWHDNIILTMSLSKLGLPGARTGIVIANKEIIQALSSINAITALAPNSMGACLTNRLLASGDIMSLREDIIRPFYHEKSQFAAALAEQLFANLPIKIHKPEGAFFLWIWCQELPITSKELYERLVKRGVYIIPGEYFFPDKNSTWKHQTECLRVTFTQEDEVLERGFGIIAEELRKVYQRK